jgi:hypothetical protein
LTDDLKVKVSNNKMGNFAFYYWLSIPYLLQGVGKVI